MSTSQSLKSLAVRITQDLRPHTIRASFGTSVSVPHSVACAEWTRDKKNNEASIVHFAPSSYSVGVLASRT